MTNKEYLQSKGDAGKVWLKKHSAEELLTDISSSRVISKIIHFDFPLKNGNRSWVSDGERWLTQEYDKSWEVGK